MHFFHVFPTFDAGGLEVRAAQLMEALGPGVRHTVVSMDGKRGCLERIAPEVRLTMRAAPRAQSAVRTPGAMARAIFSEAPDLVLTYNWGAIESVLGASLARAPAIIHHEDGFGPEETEGSLARRTMARRVLLPAARGLIVPSRTLEKVALQIWKQPRERVHYFPNGVDVERFRPEPRPAGGDVVIGHVGRFRPEKNQAALIRALAASPVLRARARLALVGDGALLEASRSLARDLGVIDRVEFLGSVTDTAAVYRTFDIYALPSLTEQMPLSVLEAMATGLPIVASAVGDVPEMVAPEGSSFIVPPRDEALLIRALETLTSAPDMRRRLGATNRARAESVYPLGACLARYVELYLAEVGAPRSRGDGATPASWHPTP